MPASIQLLPANQIDAERWNACVRNNNNGLIYSQTPMLTALADNWHGLVIADYAAVMAIPWRKKWGIRYAYVPAFMQQLGFTGTLHKSLLQESLPYIEQLISLGDFQFNYDNTAIITAIPDVRKRINQVIDLQQPYQNLYHQFSNDAKRNMHQSEKHNLLIQTAWRDDIWDCFFAEMKTRYAPNMQDIHRFKQACALYFESNECHIRWIENDKKELLAAWVGLQDNRRLYNLLNVTTTEGRKKSANFYLFNSLIQEWCEKPILFDCEGSELPGVQAFYNHWGASTETYFQFRLNRLPFPLHLFKR
ncbi:MAG: hypothetical protein FGM61_09600 [Sediminibacterium sp.]|nr:hypothetical protein [Sediminibacterium sp.]